MLILIAIVAILASFGIEEVFHRLKNRFEIVWPEPVIEPKNALALEIAAKLRIGIGNLNAR